jgi:hypothetical protein
MFFIYSLAKKSNCARSENLLQICSDLISLPFSLSPLLGQDSSASSCHFTLTVLCTVQASCFFVAFLSVPGKCYVELASLAFPQKIG